MFHDSTLRLVEKAQGKFRVNPKKRLSPERDIQVAVVKLLKKYAKPGTWCAIPNGGQRMSNVRIAMKLKAEGFVSGAPDMLFVLPGGRAAFIEFKAPARPGSGKGVISPEQLAFRDGILAQGGNWQCAFSVREATDILSTWGVLSFTVELREQLENQTAKELSK